MAAYSDKNVYRSPKVKSNLFYIKTRGKECMLCVRNFMLLITKCMHDSPLFQVLQLY